MKTNLLVEVPGTPIRSFTSVRPLTELSQAQRRAITQAAGYVAKHPEVEDICITQSPGARIIRRGKTIEI